MASGLAGLPAARSEHAPRFSNQDSESISDFLREYEALTSGLGVSDQDKVTNITRYTPSKIAEFWVLLDGYDTKNWKAFCAELNSLYRRAKSANNYSRAGLQEFITLSAHHRLKDEDDIIVYYRRFLQFSKPLLASRKLTVEEQNADFFNGFHPQDRDIISNRLFAMDPNRTQSDAPDLKDTLMAAKGC
jgi:hypothetical protein